MSGRKTRIWERGLSLLLAVLLTVSSTSLNAFATELVTEDEMVTATAEPGESAETADQRPEDESETPAEESADQPSDAPAEEMPDTPADAPVEALAEAPANAPVEALAEAPANAPVEAPANTPVEAPADAPVEALAEAPVEAPANAPVKTPADASAEDLVEGPAEEQPEAPAAEPEVSEPEREAVPLALKLKTEEHVTYTFVTEDEVIWADVTPTVSLWGREEHDKYKDFEDVLGAEEQIVAAFVLTDGTAEENPVTLTETSEVIFASSDWDWSELSRNDVGDAYTLYLSDNKGEMKPVSFDVLLRSDRDNDHGDALSFTVDTLSYLVLTETVPAETEEHTDLVEVPASDNEPLLANGALTAESRKLLSGRPRRAGTIQQEPVSADGTTIERVTVRWVSKSTGSDSPAGFDRLELAPVDTDEVPNQQFQIDFSLSGKNKYEPGDIEIVFPAYIWLDRDGKEPGELTLAVPEDPGTGAEFAWRRVGDQIIVTNTKRLSPASKVLIQGTFRSVEAHAMVDIDTIDTSARYKGISDAFSATVSVQTENNVLTMTSNKIDASLDTYTSITSATKTAYDQNTKDYRLYYDIPSSLPEEFLPENPEDYFYVCWYVSGTAGGNQPFTMTVTDQTEDLYGEIILGAQSGDTLFPASADGSALTATLYEGYSTVVKSAYVWTAYRTDQLPETGEFVDLSNTQTITVTGVDDGIPHIKSATATVPVKLPAIYHFVKEWDDDDDIRGRRPDYMYVYVYDSAYSANNPWKTIRVEADENGDWTCQWSDEGRDHTFWIREYLPNGSGIDNEYYDLSGDRHALKWNYYLESTDYDSDTRTYTYVNSYSEGWIEYDVSGFVKTVGYDYRAASQTQPRNRALNELLRGNPVEVPFSVSGTLAPALWTVHEGKKPVTVGIVDDVYRFVGNSASLDGVEIAAVSLVKPVVYSYQNYNDETGRYQRIPVTEDQTVRIYGYVNDAWVLLANMEGSTVTAVEGSGASVNGSRLELPKGTAQVKAELDTSEALVYLSYTVYLRVNPTEQVLNAINAVLEESDYATFTLENEAEAYGFYNGEQIIQMRDVSTGYLHGRMYKVAVDLEKEFTFVSNDVNNAVLTLHTKATLLQQSNVTDRNEYNTALADGTISNTESGTYYDLLPAGVMPDISTIRLSNDGSVAAAYTIENWRDTGRIMLVVKVENQGQISYDSGFHRDPRYTSSFPAEGWRNKNTIEFDAYYSYADAKEYGLEGLRNVIAYESDEEVLANIRYYAGEPDDPTAGKNVLSEAAVGADANLFTGLDGDRTDPAFAYASDVLDLENIDLWALTSIQKHVTADGFGTWSLGQRDSEVNVQEGGRYTYRLSVQSDTDVTTRDIIILDSLENYAPTADDGEDYDEANDLGRWHGSFLSLDVSQLVKAGVRPVVYYSTVQGLDLSRAAVNPDLDKDKTINWLQNNSVWSTALPADPSTVTAIAIDATMGQDGEPFELKEGESLMAYIHMQAPVDEEGQSYLHGDGKTPAKNAHTYNNAYLDCNNIKPGDGSEEHAYVVNNYTRVGIYSRSLNVTKVWDDENDNDGLRPDHVTVHLLANGKPTGRTLELNAENNWTGAFDRVLTYDHDGNYIIYSFTEDEVEGYSLRVRRSGENITLTNHHDLIKTEIPVTKLWEDDDESIRPASVTMRLLADGVFTGKTLILRADNNGEWKGTFTDLNRYRDQGIEIVYTVEEAEVDDYKTASSGSAEEGYTFTNRYYPYGDLIVSKTVENTTDRSADKVFTFTLTLTNTDGSEVINRYSYSTSDGRTGTLGTGDEFTLAGGQTLTVKDIPTHISYTVTEQPASGFILAAASGDTGTIRSNTPAEAAFTNRYSASGTLQLSVQKTLEGRPEIQRYQFRFQIKDSLDEEAAALRTASCTADGTAAFGVLRYTEADNGKEFTYYISEIERGKPGYTYDSDIVVVKVTPTDNGDGTMACIPAYYAYDPDAEGGVGEQLTGIAFQNEYHAEGDITLRAWKSLPGGTLTDGQFTFELLDAEGTLLGTTTNNEKGEIAWDALHFNQDDVGKTILYIAREVTGEDPAVVYDTALKGYEITVIDNDDGTLSFTQTNVNVTSVTDDLTGLTRYEKAEGEAGLPIFLNGLADGSLSVTKYTTGEGADPDKEFTFHVRLIGDQITDETKIAYHRTLVENTVPEQEPASNPTPARTQTMSSPTGGSVGTDAYAILYVDGELVFQQGYIPERDRETVGTWSAQNTGTRMPGWCGDNSTSITTVTFRDKIAPTSTNSWFYGCSNLTTINSIHNLVTSNVTDMSYMFHSCSSLTSLDVTGFDTSSVKNMSAMFYECTGLTSLDLSKLDTSNVTDMFAIFSGSDNLSSVTLGANFSFKGKNITSTDYQAILPTPSGSAYTGKWTLLEDESNAFTPAQLRDNYNSSMAGTWVWEIATYTVHFDPNGGTGEMEDRVFNCGSDVTLPGCTFQNDVDFLGWATDPNATKAEYEDEATGTFSTEKDGEVTLYVVWDVSNKYTIHFKAQDGAAGSMPTKHWDPDLDFTIPTCTFERYGYQPVRWEGSDGKAYDLGGTIPANTFSAGNVLTLTAILEPIDYEADLTDSTFDLTLKGGEQITIPDLPAGTAYQVWEDTPAGWVLLTQENASGVIQPLETAEASFTNKYQPGTATAQIVGSKTLNGSAAAEGAFAFQLLEGTRVLQTVSNVGGGFIQFAAIQYTVDDLGVHTYTVREVRGGDSAIDYDTHTETVTVTVSGSEDNLTAAVTYDSDGVKFANTTRPGSLEITKVAEVPEGYAAAPDQQFSFRVTLTNDSGRPLTDSQQSWYVKDAASSPAPARTQTMSSPTPAGTLQGKAYAVLTRNKDNEYELIFFRSSETYTNGETGTFTDIDGNLYTGRVYAGFETESYAYSYYVPWDSIRSNIQSVRFAQTIAPRSTAYWFYQCSSLKSVDLSKFDTSSVTNMRYMFYNCWRLSNLDVSKFDTSNVTDMSYMFYYCCNLTSLEVSNFDTSKVTKMIDMFSSCSSLTSLEVSKFDTSNVTDMSSMFSGCSSLTSLEVSNFDTSNVTSMGSMFSSCSSLTSLNLSKFDTSKVTDMGSMFKYCEKLTSLDVSKFDTSNVTDMSYMFYYCSNLTSLDVSNFDTSKVTNMYGMFRNCNSLTSLDLSEWKTSKVTDMGDMFSYCRSLTSLNLSGFNTSNVTNMGSMFERCEKLTSLDVSNFDTSKVTKMIEMFSSCSSLTSLDVSGFNTSNVTSMGSMFSSCSSLTSLEVSNFDTSKVTNMYGMFRNCSSLTELDLSNFDTSNVTNMYYMFSGCSSLSSVTLGANFSFKGKNITSTDYQAILPDPPYTSPYTEKWVLLEDESKAFTAAQLRDDYNGSTMAGTWVWQVQPDACIVRYDANGGSITGKSTASVTMNSPVLTLPSETTTSRPGYLLTGWSTDTAGQQTVGEAGKRVNLSSVAKYGSFITLYAQWEENVLPVGYTVEHYQQRTDLGGYTLAETEALQGKPGSEQTPKTKTYARFRSPDTQTVTLKADGSTVVKYYYDRTVYTIAFNANTGEGSMNDLHMIGGIGEALPTCKFQKKNALFTGWNTAEDGSGTAYGDGQTVTDLASDGQTVTLYAQWLTGEGYHTDEPMDGSFVVTITAGQTAVIPNLPAGTAYHVEEIDLPDGWVLTNETGVSGSIFANSVGKAVFTNTYAAEGDAFITAHKALTGGAVAEGDFTFELLDAEGSVVDTAVNGAADTVTQITEEDGSTTPNPWYGTAPVYFDTLHFTQPGEYTYYIREQVGSDQAVIYDSHKETVSIVVKDNRDGTLSAEVSYDEDGAIFTNSMKSGSLTVSKTVKNGTDKALEQTFDFTVDLKNADGSALTGSYPVTKSDGAEITVPSGGTVSIKAGETFTISDLPHGCLYTITEQDKAGFELTGSVNTAGVIDAIAEGGQTASFENTYSSSGSVTLTADKTLVGGDIEDEQFSFALTDETGSVLATAWAQPDGSITFTPLDYSETDDGKTYVYTISEIAGEDERIVYDAHEERVTVTVTDNGDGTMNAAAEYADAEGARFVNLQLYRLSVSKTVAGNMGDQTAGFSFTLTLTRNDEPYTGAVGAPDGVNWTAGESGVYTFTLSHGDSFGILLPVDVVYEITETDPEDYKVTIAITDSEGAALENESNAPTAKGSISRAVGDQSVSFINSREMVVPTGAAMPALPTAIGAGALALAGLAVLLLKKRRRGQM